MPIGKNSLTRVANNGYTNVKSEAPDMENSVALPISPDEKPAEKPEKKAAPKKTDKKGTSAKKGAVKKAPAPKAKKEATVKVVETPPSVVFPKPARPLPPKPYRNIGDPLPVWLL